jgi:hypothetical protein
VHWMTPKSQLPHNRERGVQMDRQRPEAAEFGWTSDCSRVAGQDLRRWLVAGDAEKTECDERVAQRCGESPRLTPFQKHEGERGMFMRLHHEISCMRIGVENVFGKSGKQRIEDKKHSFPQAVLDCLRSSFQYSLPSAPSL